MSRTLFRYIFWDLIKIFMMASGVLSAIMSFGGLLKPLYEVGLDITQVGQILGFSGPAMTAYSLPIAALFATTIVYGRLGADNEITACRAAGISHLALAMPAFMLGALTALISIGLLCFVVPASMLKVEKIIYSNLAQLAVGQIERTHQVKFDQQEGSITVFAQSAKILPIDPTKPQNQGMQVDGAMIVEYHKIERNRPQIPRDFYMARSARAYIQQEHEDDDVLLWVDFSDATRFPRATTQPSGDNAQFSLKEQRVGPFVLQSPVSENTKFMDLFNLQNLLKHPEHSRRIGEKLRAYIRRDQQREYLSKVMVQLNEADTPVELGVGGAKYRLTRSYRPAVIQNDQLVILGSLERPVRLVQIEGTSNLLNATAREIRLSAAPFSDRQMLEVTAEMIDSKLWFADGDSTTIENRLRKITVPMSPAIVSLATRPASEYRTGRLPPKDHNELERNILKQDNSVRSELHARMSFAVSCYILVMVGCALGMMFRSGNFLSAFAVSVIPALICIALVVTGQHTCENVPATIPANWTNPYWLGVGLIWSGNAAVFVIAVVLLGRLQRQ